MWKFKEIENYEAVLPPEELMKRTRIVVIDDEDTFPFDVLKTEGFSIDHWSDVLDLSKLERGFYDIIILDIGGIGRELDSDNEGLAVLRHIKGVNPSQIVIAHSGQSYESSKIAFFQQADQYVPKPTSALSWKEILDDIIRTKMSVAHYWGTLKCILQANGLGEKQVKKVEKVIIKAGQGRSGDIGDSLTKVVGKVDNIATLICIAAKIASLCGDK